MLKKSWLIVVLVTLLVGTFAGSAQDTQTLTVFAATSLTDAFADIATMFQAENPGGEALFSFGGSSARATQLVEGAPVDGLRQRQQPADDGRPRCRTNRRNAPSVCQEPACPHCPG